MQGQWDLGDCWLWCQRAGVPVLWLGPVKADGQYAPLYACEWCVRRVETQLSAYLKSGRVVPGSGHHGWVVADCWLWCERTNVPALWVGCMERANENAPVYVCDQCLPALENKLHAYLERDRAPAC